MALLLINGMCKTPCREIVQKMGIQRHVNYRLQIRQVTINFTKNQPFQFSYADAVCSVQLCFGLVLVGYKRLPPHLTFNVCVIDLEICQL